MPHYTVLYNPHAAGGHGEENAKKLAELLPRAQLTFQNMTGISDYAAFFASLPPESALVVSGGDGTLNRFLNDTDGLPLPSALFYFAGGSGNDFMRDVAEHEMSRVVPLSRYLASLPCVSVKGLLFHYKPANAVITVDGTEHRYQKVWLAPTMNGRYYGGGMMPAPQQLRLNEAHTVSTMVFHGAGKLRALRIFPGIFKGEHVRFTKEVDVLTGRSITVSFDRPTALQIDGETILDVTSYHVTAAPQSAEKSCV